MTGPHPGGRKARRLGALALALVLCAPGVPAQSITNTASVTYQVGPQRVGVILNSNTVSIRATPAPSPAQVRFYQYAPGAPGAVAVGFDGGGYGGALDDDTGASYAPLGAPSTIYGDAIALSGPIAVRETTTYHAGEPVFITLEDANRNLDSGVREFINLTLANPVTGDSEVLRLQETGPDTGVFAAAIQSSDPGQPAVAGDGRITVDIDTTLQVVYVDPTDPADAVEDAALVDPFGTVFDSSSGLPIAGATVTLINVDTGRPARVFCDDGLTTCPSTLVTHAEPTPVAGLGIVPAGGFRFPFVQPGRYRIVVVVPPTHTVPSTACGIGCTTLDPAGRPYAVVAGSHGDVFVVVPGPALNIDVPADPVNGTLLVRKAAGVTEVSAGDFLQYRVSVQNIDTADAVGTVLTDTLPAGFRYQPGSLRIEGMSGPPPEDPSIAADGRTLTVPLGTIAGGSMVEVRYVAQVVARGAAHAAVNRAVATAAGGVSSNTALAAVRVREALFSGAFTLIGRVSESCAPAAVACPARDAAPPATAEYTVRAQFDSGRASLKTEGRRELDALAARLRGRDIERIELVGHTDDQRLSRATAARFGNNYGLSEARAHSVGAYLAQALGLRAEQIRAAGKGPDEPVASNDTPAGMARNRRTEVRVYERQPAAAAAAAACAAAAPAPDRGVANVRLVLEDGTYATTDADGLYHFEGVRPGTHVVQIDPDSLAPGVSVVPRIQNTRFAGRSASQFVEAQGGALWRADFNVCSVGEPVQLTLSSERGVAAGDGDAVREYTVRAQFDSGRHTLQPEGERDLGALVTRLAGLAIERIEVIGHTDSQRLSPAIAARFKDNYGLSEARARTVGEFLARGLGLAPAQVSVAGRGPDEPVAANAGAANRAKNRRTEVRVHLRERGAPVLQRDRVRHRVELEGGAVPVRNLLVTVRLPPGAAYAPGSARLDGAAVTDPGILDGIATFRVGDTGAHWRRALEFDVTLPAAAEASCAEGAGARAVATFEAAGAVSRTPPAETALPCPPPADATEPTRTASAPQRVRVRGAVEKAAPAPVERTAGHRGAVRDDADAAGGKTDWLAGARPGIEWLFPPPEHNPRAPATRVAIKHAPGQTVVLEYVAGEAVSPLNFDGTAVSDDKTVAVSVWRGVPLQEGENRFAAIVMDGGGVVQRLRRSVHYSNAPVSVELVPEQSALMADGIHPPVIAVRLRDREGRPVRDGVTGAYALGAPFLPRQTLDQMQQRQLAGLDRFTPTWRIEGDDGVAYIELQPTTDSGEAVLTFTFPAATSEQAPRRQELRTWIAAAPREWMLVGFAEGTVGYTTLKERAVPLPQGSDEHGYTDGQASLYAKGRVLGEWLLTLAYDSDKPGDRDRRRSLLSTIDPDEYYTLYGDGAEQRYDAPSQEKLYLKLERRQFYALFGDYDTGLTATQLSRYSRTLNGVKAELGGGPLVLKAFASETAQDLVRDEIRGDGTSGLYRLSRRGIVLNSDKIALETRDRYRSERILESRLLVRHLDYDIDYANGTLFFREPVPSRDPGFNPVYIVAEYETFGAGEAELNAGGRAGVRLLDGRLEAGATGVHEQQFLGESGLAGADLRLRVDEATEIRVEGARSHGEQAGLPRQGEAHLAEVEHHGTHFDALVYTRRQAAGFGLQQQNGSEAATEKLGTDLAYHLTPALTLQGQLYRQENLSSEATREVGSARLQYRSDGSTLSAGYQAAEDRAASGESLASRHATLGASRWFMDRALELSASSDVALGEANENTDFPARYQVGAAYAITPEARLLLTQELTDGEAFDTTMTRAGVQAVPWRGARLTTTLNQGGITEYGPRTFAQMGLSQALLLGDRWGVDFGVDSSRTLRESGQPAFVLNPEQAAAVGGGDLTDDFVAVTGGLTYRSELWSWNGRAESRDGASTDRQGLTTGFLRQARAGVAFAAQLQWFRTELVAGADGRYGSASLAWAWRPLGSRWSVLDRLELKHDELDDGNGLPGGAVFGHDTLNVAGDAASRRLINNLNVNRVSREWEEADRQGNLFRLEQRSQWSLYYGAKYAVDRYDGTRYRGFTDLTGFELRHDLRRWLDVGLQASALHAWTADLWDYSAGPQVGVTPFDNAWVSLGYNVVGFHDRDFDAARYTAQGPYLRLRFKFDQDTRLPGPDRQPPHAESWEDYAGRAGAETGGAP